MVISAVFAAPPVRPAVPLPPRVPSAPPVPFIRISGGSPRAKPIIVGTPAGRVPARPGAPPRPGAPAMPFIGPVRGSTGYGVGSTPSW